MLALCPTQVPLTTLRYDIATLTEGRFALMSFFTCPERAKFPLSLQVLVQNTSPLLPTPADEK